MSTGEPHLTLLVPCFDEEAHIARCLEAAQSWAAQHEDLAVEVLCVDDGSRDGTAAEVERIGRSWSAVRLERRATNAGKGAALKTGMATAKGRYVVFLDADLAVDCTHLDAALLLLEEGADVVVGCRNVPGAAIRRKQSFLRRTLGRGYLKTARLLLGLRVSDVTCGFKGFRREVGERLFEGLRARKWGFDAEVLYLAQKARCNIREMPVQWYDGEVSAVRLHRDVPGALRELLGVRLRHLFRTAPEPAARAESAGTPAPTVPAGTVRDG